MVNTIKHHDNMSSYMSAFLDECLDAMTPEEDDMLKQKLTFRSGIPVSHGSLYTGSGVSGCIYSAHLLTFPQ